MTKDQELLEAARTGNVNTVLKLLDSLSKRSKPFASMRRSLNVNYKDVNGHTALHHACLSGHLHIVCMLLEFNAHLDVPDVSGSTPLYWAAWAGHLEIVHRLLMHKEVPANPNALTKNNETPLHCAAQHDRNEVVKLLLQFGADPTLRNDSFQTPLDLAATYGRLTVVETLLRTHPELLACYQLHRQPTISTEQNQEQNVPYTVTPTKHIFTHTCLHLASRNGHKEVVEALLQAGVYINVKTPVGTALHEAAAGGRKAVVTVLLAAGIDVNARNSSDLTALDLLKDLPTFEIVTMIKDFALTDTEPQTHAITMQPMQIDSDSENNYKRVATNNQLSNRVPDLLPKNANLQANYSSPNFLEQREEQHQPVSIASPEFYLKMKAVYWPTPISKPLQVPVYKPVYKLPNIDNSQSNTTALFRPIKSAASDNDSISMRSNTMPRPHRISSDYVEMSEFVASDISRSSTPKNKQQQQLKRLSTHSMSDCGNLQSQPLVQQLPLPTTAILTDANNNHNKFKLYAKHSPTPEFPPPTFREAEQTITQVLYTMSRRVNYQLDDYPLREESPISINSQVSDCVEQFLGDGGPYAGLFKGSTLNLNLSDHEQVDGHERAARKMTPSLSKSRILKSESVERILQQQTKANCVNAVDLNEPEADINIGKEWQEIDSIFESIGQEMSEAQQEDAKLSNMHHQPQPTNVIMRQPAELLLGLSNNMPNNWLHDSNKLIYEEIIYKVYYLGSTVIRQLHGTASTRKSIQKLKIDERLPENEAEAELLQDCNNSTKYLKAQNVQKPRLLQLSIALSHTGVEFIDLQQQLRICAHAITNINCVCQDAEDMRYFAYITREQDMHYSHVFMADSVKLAADIILTLGQAFEIAYQLMLRDQQQEGCA